MRETADVVQVEGVGGVVGTRDVRVRPVGSLLEVEGGIDVGCAGRQVAARRREVQLDRGELEIAPPLGLRIEAERQVGEQVALRVRVGQVEDVLAGEQAVVRERGIALPVDLEAQAERGRHASREVRTDERPGRTGAEHGPVADVPVPRIGPTEGVVLLRQAPQVVVAHDLRVPGAEPHLEVEGPRDVVPHPQEPVRSELRLGGEVRGRRAGAHLRREVTDADEQHVRRVAEGLHALDVVPGIPPSARRIDLRAERREVAREAPALVDVRREVGRRRLVVEMRGRRAQRRVGDEVRTVAFGPVEGERVRERLLVHGLTAPDGEARGGRGSRPAHVDRVRAGRDHLIEVERVHERVGVAPRSEQRTDRPRRGHDPAVPHRERGAGLGDAGHQIGPLRRGGRVADLVDADERRDRGGAGRNGQTEDDRGERDADREDRTARGEAGGTHGGSPSVRDPPRDTVAIGPSTDGIGKFPY